MKILIFSDSHGRQSNMQKALDAHPDAELLLFLGDGINDIKQITDNTERKIPLYAVRGNCDIGLTVLREYSDRQVFSVMGKNIFMCHGHIYGIGNGSGALLYAAMEAEAQICLYGHTHVKHNEYLPDAGKNGLYLFNPGSITIPRDCMTPSYGILEIRENGILLSHGYIH